MTSPTTTDKLLDSINVLLTKHGIVNEMLTLDLAILVIEREKAAIMELGS